MKSYLLLLICIFGCVASTMAQQISLVDNERTGYRIILPRKASPIEQKAATELQSYLKEISGVLLPITNDATNPQPKEILIGNTNRSANMATRSSADGVIIKTVKEKIFITGGNRKGVLYAVYTFVEDYLGCRKLTKDVAVIPRKTAITIPRINYIYNPSFSYRTTHFIDAFDPAYCDWQKLNTPFEGYNSQFVHSFSTFLPPDTYFSQHPEYFALIDGVRKPSQPCLSQPKVFEIMQANLGKLIQQHPQINYWSVSQNDGYDYCHCSLCEPVYKKEDGYMGVLLPFVNKMAKKFPSKTISTLAFLFSDEPPKTIKPERNVEIVYCTWNSTREESLAISKEERAVTIRRQLQKWRKLTPNILVWDYTVAFSHAVCPYPNLYTLKPNLRFFKSLKIERMFQQGIGDMKGEFSELRCYLLSKLMWDVNINEKAVIEQFLKDYYGPAAPYLSQYITLLHNASQNDKLVLRMSMDPFSYSSGYLSLENRKIYRKLFEQAEMITKNTQYYERVVKERLALDYADIGIEAGAPTLPKNAYWKQMDKFIEESTRYNIPFLNEGRLTPVQFAEQSKKIWSERKK